MRNACCDCKYCKIVPVDGIFARFYCKKMIFQKDGVTGIVDCKTKEKKHLIIGLWN